MRPRRLSGQITLTQLVILVTTLLAGFGLVTWRLQVHIDRLYEQRALSIAETVAATDSIADQVTAGDPGGRLEQVTSGIQRQTGAAFVVITNASGIRYSHPNKSLIGKSVTDDPESRSSEPFRTGRTWVGIQIGTLGRTARGKAPLFDEGHRIVGEVSVGFPEDQAAAQLVAELPTIGLYLLATLIVGILASLGLARRLKRQTFGLELDEIAALLQEREAMLHGVREGVLGYDTKGRVLLANDKVRELLELPAGVVGRAIDELIPAGRVREVVRGTVAGADQVVVIGERVLVVNRMPIRVDYRRHLGWVVTFHDRTEPEGLLRELDTVLGLTDALRAQSHEFTNRLHTLAGLVELGRYDEAIGYVTEVSVQRNTFTDRLLATIRDPMVAALLLAKTSVALERGVELHVARDSEVNGELLDTADVITVLGNLVDNALDASTESERAPRVEVYLASVGKDLVIRVSDSGPGVPLSEREAIFTDGYSTKSSRTGARRGLGLSVVRSLAGRRSGMVQVSGGEGGAVFTVLLTGCVSHDRSASLPSPEAVDTEAIDTEAAVGR